MARAPGQCGPHGLALACLAVAACTGEDPPAQQPPPAQQHEAPALTPREPAEPATASAAPRAPAVDAQQAPGLRPRCALKTPRDAPEQALAAVIAELPVEPGFVCPGAYRRVQRLGPYDTYVGADAETGDSVWITLVHDSHAEAGEHRSGHQPREYDARCYIRGPMPAGWFCVRASARAHAGAAPLQAWLTAHPDVDAIDWISFAIDPHEEGWRALPRAFHLHADRSTTLCWQRGAAWRCWRRVDVDRSRLDVGGVSPAVELVTTTSGHDTTWTLTADGALSGETDANVWHPIESAPSELIALFPHKTIQTRSDGVVVLGRYDQVGGDGGLSLKAFAEWLVVRPSEGWTVVPVPDTIVHSVILAGESLAIVASTFRIGDGPVIERRDLLTFAPGARGPEFVGALPSEVGVTNISEGGDYTWSHAILGRAPDCLQLTAGEASGHTFEPRGDEEDGDGVKRPIRPPFHRLAGDWQITPQGPRRGCSRPPRASADASRHQPR